MFNIGSSLIIDQFPLLLRVFVHNCSINRLIKIYCIVFYVRKTETTRHVGVAFFLKVYYYFCFRSVVIVPRARWKKVHNY